MNASQRNAIQADLRAEQSDTFLQFASQWAIALDAGLVAAAEVYADAVREKLSHGYTSGRYAGLRWYGKTTSLPPVARTVKTRRPRFDKNGVRYVAVGSNHFLTRFWEFGHHNIVTKRYERVEHWRNAMNESGPEMAHAFHDVFDAVLNGAGAPNVEAAA